MHHDVRDSGFVRVLAAVAIKIVPDEVADGTAENELPAIGNDIAEITDHNTVFTKAGCSDVGDQKTIVRLTRNQHAVVVPSECVHDNHPGQRPAVTEHNKIGLSRSCAEGRRLADTSYLVCQRHRHYVCRNNDVSTTEVGRDAFTAKTGCDGKHIQPRVRGLNVGDDQALVGLRNQNVSHALEYDRVAHHVCDDVGCRSVGPLIRIGYSRYRGEVRFA